MRNFLHLLGANRLEYLAVVAATSLLMGGEAAIQPLLMKAIFDTVTTHRDFDDFIPLGLGYLALGVTVNVVAYGLFVWRTRADNRIVADVSSRLLERYYSTSYGELIRNGGGYYVARIRSDVKDGLVPMLAAARDMVVGSVSFVMLISVLVYISLPAFLVLVLMIPVFALASILISRRIRTLTGIERDFEATIVDALSRSVAAFKMVTGFSLTSSIVAAFGRTVDQGLVSTFRRSRLVRLLQMAGDLTRVTSDVSSIFVGAFLVTRRQMTVGSFIAFMNAFWRSSSTLFLVLNKWAEMHGYASTIDRLAEFDRRRPPPPGHAIGDRVSLRGVTFAYADAPVLAALSLDVAPGERVLLVGENGSGKTTLANILCGLLRPSGGRLSLPSRISGATLPLHFPPVGVRELGADPDLLDRLGLGEEATLAARPDTLSVGQQQKLAVALALSHDADLYVLDEPFANLDVHGRGVLLDEILRRTAGAMLVMIAHDPRAYARHFDRTIEIGDKRASSTREETVHGSRTAVAGVAVG